jgi:nucleotide-binding universal stress UspA family protein
MKILLAADGSAYTRAAARYLARHAGGFPPPVEIHVLHVEGPLPSEGRARQLLGSQVIADFRREESEVALAVAERELRDLDAKRVFAWKVGDIAHAISDYALEHGIDRIVVGSCGHGALAGALLGSVTQRVLREAHVPVLVVPLCAAENEATPGSAARAA